VPLKLQHPEQSCNGAPHTIYHCGRCNRRHIARVTLGTGLALTRLASVAPRRARRATGRPACLTCTALCRCQPSCDRCREHVDLPRRRSPWCSRRRVIPLRLPSRNRLRRRDPRQRPSDRCSRIICSSPGTATRDRRVWGCSAVIGARSLPRDCGSRRSATPG
jgi:hypothetical protein